MPIVDINGRAVEFPDDLTGDALNAAVKMAASQMAMTPSTAAPERGMGERVMRGAGLVGQGFNNAIGSTLGALPDAVGAGLRMVGLPSSEPGQYTKFFQGALNSLGRNDAPETTGEKVAMGVGQGVGNVVSMMAPAGVVGRMAAPGSITQGVASTMAAQPALQIASGAVGGAVEGATDSPVAGMAAGLAVPAAVMGARGLISPGGTRPSAETRRLVDVAQAEGIPLTPGQITGSRPLRTTESVFATLPSTAGRQEAMNQTQREAFNRAVLGRAGVNEPLATPEVLQAARERIGGELGDLAARNTLTVNRDVMQGVQEVANEARRYLPQDKARPVLNRIGDFIDKIDTKTFKVEGEAYAKLDSALATQIRGETDGNVRNVLQNLRDALRQGMDASISGQDAQAWQEARRQYANLSMITRAMNAPNINTAAGNIPPAALSQAMASGPARNYAMGRGDLNDLTRVGRAFIQDAIPNSGTPERLAIQGLLTGGATMGATGDLASSLGAAGLALAAPRAAQSLYNAPIVSRYMSGQYPWQAFLQQRIPQISPEALRAIAAGQTRGLLD